MDLINIAICDDDKTALNMIAGAVKSVFEANNVDVIFFLFTNTEHLDRAIKEEHFVLILLDIDMPGRDGISYGKYLREKGNETEIIYISSQESRVFEAFTVHPFGFVRKSKFIEDISEVIQQYLNTHHFSGGEKLVSLPTHYGGEIRVNTNHILYFEGNGIYQTMYMADNDPVEIVSKMVKLEKLLMDMGFMRIHKGYLANYQHITRIDNTTVTLTDGTKLPISRGKTKEVRTRYLEFGRKFGVLMF